MPFRDRTSFFSLLKDGQKLCQTLRGQLFTPRWSQTGEQDQGNGDRCFCQAHAGSPLNSDGGNPEN